jgi:hypothetical protein
MSTLEQLRKELILLGMEKGLQHPDVIRKSCQVDRLLNRWMKNKYKIAK